jgi:hypothetical protein
MITEISTAVAPSGRVDALDWHQLATDLNELGCALTGPVLSPAECAEMAALYADDSLFRSTIDMAARRFGSGQYRYFADPVPAPVSALRAGFWPHLLPVARDWAGKLGRPAPWPDDFPAWLDQCHAAGQQRPTPLLLSYGPGDWNALHQGPVRRAVLPAAGRDRPGRTGNRPHRRGVPARGAAAAGSVAWHGDHARPGTGADLHDQRAAGAIAAGVLGVTRAAGRQRRPLRQAPDAGPGTARRQLRSQPGVN